jgi:hypothetical protein
MPGPSETPPAIPNYSTLNGLAGQGAFCPHCRALGWRPRHLARSRLRKELPPPSPASPCRATLGTQ